MYEGYIWQYSEVRVEFVLIICLSREGPPPQGMARSDMASSTRRRPTLQLHRKNPSTRTFKTHWWVFRCSSAGAILIISKYVHKYYPSYLWLKTSARRADDFILILQCFSTGWGRSVDYRVMSAPKGSIKYVPQMMKWIDWTAEAVLAVRRFLCGWAIRAAILVAIYTSEESQ